MEYLTYFAYLVSSVGGVYLIMMNINIDRGFWLKSYVNLKGLSNECNSNVIVSISLKHILIHLITCLISPSH